MRMLFKQQMYFQKQQAEQLSLFQQRQAEQQAEFQKRCLDFMKGVWFWYYLIFLIIYCTKWKTGVERYISDKNESKTGQRTGILSVLGTLISEISLENGIKTVEHGWHVIRKLRYHTFEINFVDLTRPHLPHVSRAFEAALWVSWRQTTQNPLSCLKCLENKWQMRSSEVEKYFLHICNT